MVTTSCAGSSRLWPTALSLAAAAPAAGTVADEAVRDIGVSLGGSQGKCLPSKGRLVLQTAKTRWKRKEDAARCALKQGRLLRRRGFFGSAQRSQGVAESLTARHVLLPTDRTKWAVAAQRAPEGFEFPLGLGRVDVFHPIGWQGHRPGAEELAGASSPLSRRQRLDQRHCSARFTRLGAAECVRCSGLRCKGGRRFRRRRL